MNSNNAPGARSVSLLTATCIVVANMVGIGIFTSLGFQVGDLPSGFAIVVLWAIGGVCALCGALCYGELAAALPRSGGEYHFLARIFHPAVGFLAGWISATVGFAAPVALAAMAFGKYFAGALPGCSPVLLSLGVVWLATLVLLCGLNLGSVFQNTSTLFILLLLVSVVVAGLLVRMPQPLTFLPRPGDGALIVSAPFAVSLVYVMFSYSGWNASTYIIGEVRDAPRTVPLSLILGTLIVAALYLALNAVFLRTTPIPELAGQLEVGLVAGRHIFGENGARVMAALICVGLVSHITGMMWIGPRVTMAMGEDLPLLRLLAWKRAGGVPVPALLLQFVVANLLLLTSTFEAVLNYIQLSLTLCSFATVLGVIVLRFRQPNLPRPYKTWGYPVTPLIFLAISLWMIIHVLRDKPAQSLAGLGTILLGLLVYYLSPRPLPSPAPSSFKS